jgi:hypothetical protein
MYSTPKLILPAIIIILLAQSGCKKESSTNSNNTVYGYVTLYDQYGGIILTNPTPTTLTLNGNTTVTTDSMGKYTFSNLGAGEYTLSASNPGFGSINGATFQFTGGGSLDHDVKLSAIPNFTDSGLVVTTDSVTFITVTGHFTPGDLHRRTSVLFAGSSPNVTSAPASYLRVYSVTANAGNFSEFTFTIAISDMLDAGFTAGGTIYFAAYGGATNFASSSEWEDVLNTGKIDYTALSLTPATTSFILP